MTLSADDPWLGRADLAWNILLVARVQDPPPTAHLSERLRAVYGRAGWRDPAEDIVVEGKLPTLLASLAETRDAARPVSVGRAADGIVVRGHHARVDGLGLLAVVRDLVAADLTSSASGVRARPRRSTLATMVGRLVEAVARPPADLGGGRHGVARAGDVFAVRRLDQPVRTTPLAHAAVQAVAVHNREHGARAHRVALAVGVSTVRGHDLRVGDDSGFLRLTGAERLDVQSLRRALAETPLQVGGTAQTGTARRAGGLIRFASRVLASRLGSTVLVSHLGPVQATGLIDLAFYPLAGTGSGLSLGAATVEGRTTLTLRARASQHETTDLVDLLDAIARRLS